MWLSVVIHHRYYSIINICNNISNNEIMTMMMMILSLLVLLLLTANSNGSDSVKVRKAYEFTANNITANYKDWDSDLAIMFYAPW